MLIGKYRQELDEAFLDLPGLVFFGHNISTKASHPLGLHNHDGCIEIVVINKGNESYYLENRKFDLSGGDVFISFTGQPHQSGNTSQGVCEIIWLQINPSARRNFLGLAGPYGELLRTRLFSIDTHVMKTDKEGISFLKKSFDHFLKHRTEDRLYAQSLLVSFLCRLLFLQDKEKRNDEFIENILQYIDENIYDVIKIEDICSHFHLSLSGFKHKFKEYAGVTPRDYINGRKVQKAKELLKAGKNVTETAMLLSFNSCDYFSVVFKKYTACSPTAYHQYLSYE